MYTTQSDYGKGEDDTIGNNSNESNHHNESNGPSSEFDSENSMFLWWGKYEGREVPLNDESTQWAIWMCSNFDVHKYAFETEQEARDSLTKWSFSNILTYNNVEVDATGVYLAPRIGRLREAIESVRKTSSSSSLNKVNHEDSIKKEKTLKINQGEVVPKTNNSFSSSLHSGSDDEYAQGSVELVNSDWAVWIYEFYCVKRYGFLCESDARKALEEWYSVRILTFKEEEISARCRYNTDSILAIRRAIQDMARKKKDNGEE